MPKVSERQSCLRFCRARTTLSMLLDSTSSEESSESEDTLLSPLLSPMDSPSSGSDMEVDSSSDSEAGSHPEDLEANTEAPLELYVIIDNSRFISEQFKNLHSKEFADNFFRNSKLRVWVYSGDLDLVIPVIGTRKIINTLAKTLNVTTTSTYQPWYQGSQVGGWTVSWGSLVYSTVRGAGHMVPGTQPARALQLVTSFLAGDPTPP